MQDAVIIDLDGTLLDCNSFVEFVKFLIPRHPYILKDILLRKLRFISHAEVKNRILQMKLPVDELTQFVNRLLPHVRTDLLNMFKDKPVILASAAPDCYLSILADRLAIKHHIGTLANMAEARGGIKRDLVIGMLSQNNMKIGTVVTDHYDDLPLLEYNSSMGGSNILVYPSLKTKNILCSHQIAFSLFF